MLRLGLKPGISPFVALQGSEPSHVLVDDGGVIVAEGHLVADALEGEGRITSGVHFKALGPSGNEAV